MYAQNAGLLTLCYLKVIIIIKSTEILFLLLFAIPADIMPAVGGLEGRFRKQLTTHNGKTYITLGN